MPLEDFFKVARNRANVSEWGSRHLNQKWVLGVPLQYPTGVLLRLCFICLRKNHWGGWGAHRACWCKGSYSDVIRGQQPKGIRGQQTMFHLALWVALPFSFSLLQCPAVLRAVSLGILLGRIVSSRLFPMASPPSSPDHPGSLQPCLFFPLSYVFAGLCVYGHICGVHACWCQGLLSCHVCTWFTEKGLSIKPRAC